MFTYTILLQVSLLLAAPADNASGVISGTVVNGTDGNAPLAGAEVVLRAMRDGVFVPIDQTTTGTDGRFSFTGLRTDGTLIYLPGVNWSAVHYPGPRLRLNDHRTSAQVKLTAYDAVESPSPLISRRHEIQVRTDTGFVEIAETLVLDNPTLTTFVGEKQGDHPPVTLRLTLPTGFETVTFEKEFHGRQFQIHNPDLVTTIPWPPGQHELKFTYRLPVEHRRSLLQHQLNLPTEYVRVDVMGKGTQSVACNLPAATPSRPGELAFEYRGEFKPAGDTVELTLGDAALPWDAYARWMGLALLLALIAGSIVSVGWRSRRRAGPEEARTNDRDQRITSGASSPVTSLSANPRIRGNGRRARRSSPADRPL